jgi:hypothetical protein
MKKVISLFFCISVFLTYACEKKENSDLEFILNNDLRNGLLISGFSFKKMDTISYPNSENIIPDFIVGCFINEFGIITKGPFLCHQDLEDRFVLINSYENIVSAQNHFDTISTISNKPYQTFTSDIEPLEIWQIKTSTDEIGLILIEEAKAENIEGSGFAEVKFKAKKITP